MQIPSGGVLAAGTTYNCFVLSYALAGGTGASSCSSPAISIQTLPQPATSVATVETTEAAWTGSWAAASAGAQSYKINCIDLASRRRRLLNPGPDCASGGVYVDASSTGGTITGLSANSNFACWIITYASLSGTGSFACSDPFYQVTTGPAVVTNINTVIVTESQWQSSWTLPGGNSGFQSLKVNCNPYVLPAAAPVCQKTTALNGAVNSVVLADCTTAATLTGLAQNTNYACYVISYTAADGTGTASCSAVKLIKTDIL